jgi:maltose alpha-D-glucosyltransferase/alpha-amylase
LFLRDQDELSLALCTDAERDAIYQAYAVDPHMRVNGGICRRLAPLFENDRRRLELGYALLLSLPGSPVIYYGNEIGMGDNVYLGDRASLRTPMQWSGDRNGGFSRADAARLYAPVNADPVYGYQAVNVDAQQRQPFSLLNWMRRLIAVRQRHQAFGRGTIEFLEPLNQSILAYIRRHADERILTVANLSGKAQSVDFLLSLYAGTQPVELLGGTRFRRIGAGPYSLALGPYGFYWLLLSRRAVRPMPPNEFSARTPVSETEATEAPAARAGVN